jgi:hypothetical protein
MFDCISRNHKRDERPSSHPSHFQEQVAGSGQSQARKERQKDGGEESGKRRKKSHHTGEGSQRNIRRIKKGTVCIPLCLVTLKIFLYSLLEIGQRSLSTKFFKLFYFTCFQELQDWEERGDGPKIDAVPLLLSKRLSSYSYRLSPVL